MKRFTVFETLIVSLLVGIVAAAYVVFLKGNNAFIGSFLSSATLLPLLHLITIPGINELVLTFIFVIMVFLVYGLVVYGLIALGNKTAITAMVIIFAAVCGIAIQQYYYPQEVTRLDDINPAASIMVVSRSHTPEQYFGQEARGDLNGDSKDDVAFLIPRFDDETNSTIYYVSAALKEGKGYTGTNLLFLGLKSVPVAITIEHATVTIDYRDLRDEESTTTKKFNAHLVNGKLQEI